MTLTAPVRLIRFVRFDGRHLHFFDNQNPTKQGSLPLADAYHELARQLPSQALCKATVFDGVIVLLEQMRTKTPGA